MGRKVNRERKILEVSVDKGMEDGEKACLSTETHSRKGDSSFSSTWFSRLPWSPASLRNLHPYCHLRMSLSSPTKLMRWTSTISTQRQTDSNNITEWATGISTTMTKAITDILEDLAFSVPRSR